MATEEFEGDPRQPHNICFFIYKRGATKSPYSHFGVRLKWGLGGASTVPARHTLITQLKGGRGRGAETASRAPDPHCRD